MIMLVVQSMLAVHRLSLKRLQLLRKQVSLLPLRILACTTTSTEPWRSKTFQVQTLEIIIYVTVTMLFGKLRSLQITMILLGFLSQLIHKMYIPCITFMVADPITWILYPETPRFLQYHQHEGGEWLVIPRS